jgi:uncharacterized protein (TIGR03437 family)
MLHRLAAAAVIALVTPLSFADSLPGHTQNSGASFSTFLKADSTITQVATDAAGYIYVFGTAGPVSGPDASAFVQRLNPAGSAVLYTVYLGGSDYYTRAGAMAVDPAGNVYVTGCTTAPEFPTLPVAAALPGGNVQLPFVTKLDTNGVIVYSVLFSNGVGAYPSSIAVDANGDAVVSGNALAPGFPATPGAYSNAWTPDSPFITKLDPTGTRLLFSSVGVGGTALVLDGAGDIVVAGTTWPQPSGFPVLQYPTTSGAYRTSYTPRYGDCGIPCMTAIPLGEQYVSKLSADGARLLYSTFVTGSLDSYNAGVAADSAGNIWVTGTTASPDYPYTSGQAGSDTFTTQLDPTLSKVLLSVPQGGSSLSLDSHGNLIEAGIFSPSPEGANAQTVVPAPPPLGSIPGQCLPTASGAFIMQLNGKDGSLLAAKLLPVGTPVANPYQNSITSSVDAQGNIYVAGSALLPDATLSPGVVYDPAVRQPTASGAWLARTSFTAPADAVACVTDATSPALLGPVAPGQLITLIGSGIGPDNPVIGLYNGQTSVPTALGGVTVSFDGQNAPILYASSTQINVQVPFEVRNGTLSTLMEVSYNGVPLEARMFAIAPENPSLFVSSAVTGSLCGLQLPAGQTVLLADALNEDGSLNSCSNPARVGSLFMVFVNGVGAATGNERTGGYASSNPEYLTGPVALFNNGLSVEVEAATGEPNSVYGIGRVTARVPTITAPGTLGLTLNLGGLVAGPFSATRAGVLQKAVYVFVAP